MTALQAFITFLGMAVFTMVVVALIVILRDIDEGDYKKAIITSIFAVILTIIAFAGILVAF